MEVLLGIIAIDTKVGVTAKNVMVVEPEIEPEVATIVEVPTPAPEAKPVAVMMATEGSEEVQDAELVRFWVLPSLKVPVAVNC